MSTIFGKIIAGELPSEKMYEDELLIAIKDINPQAPVHILLIPKEAFPSLQQVPVDKLHLIGHIAKIAQQLAKEHGIDENYRLLTNNGEEAGQTVFHLHFHLLGGRPLGALC